MSMITFTNHCENSHKCINGSHCVSNKSIKLGYNCDCDEQTANPSYADADLPCVHKGKIEYCVPPPDPNDSYTHFPVSFCTNMGTCKAKITTEEK